MAKQLFIKGLRVEVPAGKDSAFTAVSFPVETELHGLIVYPQDAVYGDIGKLEIVRPPVGQVLASYSEDAYLSPKAAIIEIQVGDKDDQATVPAGLVYRFTYDAVDTAGRRCIVWLRLKK